MPTQFDEPSLKSAIQRTWGAEVAPDALRQRILQDLAEHKQVGLRWRRIARNPLVGLAVAAMLIIVFGVTTLVVRRSFEPTFPSFFADAVVKAHDQAMASSNGKQVASLPIKTTNVREIRSVLSSVLNLPVTAAHVSGWKFQGAGITSVAEIPAAQLFFTRDGQSLSIFTVSTGAAWTVPVVEGKKFSETDQGHKMAAYTYGGALHVVVAYDDKNQNGVSLGDVMAVRDALQSDRPLTINPDLPVLSHH